MSRTPHPPHAPTGSRWPDLSSPGVGRSRRVLLPGALLLCLVGAGIAGAGVLLRAHERTRVDRGHASEVLALQALLPGQTVEVLAEPGAHAWRQGDAELLSLRAEPDGEPQRLVLCAQQTGAPDDPRRLYPIAILGAVPAAEGPLAIRRNPLVLPPTAAAGLPAITVHGRAGDGQEPPDLRLTVHPPAGTSVATAPAHWAVAMGVRLQEAPPSIAHAESRAAATTYRIGSTLWVLWTPATGTRLEAAGPDLQPVLTTSYDYALRIVQVPDTTCRSGALEFQLFHAVPRDGHRPSVLWALDTRAPFQAPVRLLLPPGHHPIPLQPPPPLEDEQLFERLVERGLIGLRPDGRIEQPDAGRLLGDLESEDRSLIRQLHRSAVGQQVQAQLQAANQVRHGLAFRVRHPSESAADASVEGWRWRATSGHELLAIWPGMPPASARLFDVPQEHWSEWQRIAAPQAWLASASQLEPAHATALGVRLELRAAARRAPNGPVEVLLLGRLIRVRGAEVTRLEDACTGPACPYRAWLQRVTLRPQSGQDTLQLDLEPHPSLGGPASQRWERQAIQAADGQTLRWAAAPASDLARKSRPAVEVRVLARDGTLLYADDAPTDAAWRQGLVPVVGLGPQHEGSVAGQLARLGRLGRDRAEATTSIDNDLQILLARILQCIAGAGGRWVATQERCSSAGSAAQVVPHAMAAAIVLDAVAGDIVAAVPGVAHIPGVPASELLAFDAYNPGTSPLRVAAWQHQGGSAHAPGSAFKVVDGLALEHAAQSRPAWLPVLRGLELHDLDVRAAGEGKPFRTDSPCYPAPCSPNRVQLRNHRDVPATNAARNGQLGLVEALAKSVNTWFAWTVESTDATVRPGHADARPLGAAALRAERPLLATLAELRFAEVTPLDGGLFPPEYPWLAADVLRVSPGRLDPVHDVHGVRQQALGLRMQTTPLQMARITAAIATGLLPTPRLLVRLNGTDAEPGPSVPLSMPLERVRLGMQEVVQRGTASSAFAGPGLAAARRHVFGKTGTAPLASRDDTVVCHGSVSGQPLALACLHNAWFVGYLKPGALPQETRTLAFAVQVSHTPMTGGAQAAPVIAALVETLWARDAARRQTSAGSRP